jgi:hypothetical protein
VVPVFPLSATTFLFLPGSDLKKVLSRARKKSMEWGGPGSEFTIMMRKKDLGVEGVAEATEKSKESGTCSGTSTSTRSPMSIGFIPDHDPDTIHYLMRASSAQLARGWVERLNRAVELAVELQQDDDALGDSLPCTPAQQNGHRGNDGGVPSVEEARYMLVVSKDTQHVIGMDDHHHGREMTAHLGVHHITTETSGDNRGKVTMYFAEEVLYDAAKAWVIATKQVEIEKHIGRGCPRESCQAARSKRGLPLLIDPTLSAAIEKVNGIGHASASTTTSGINVIAEMGGRGGHEQDSDRRQGQYDAAKEEGGEDEGGEDEDGDTSALTEETVTESFISEEESVVAEVGGKGGGRGGGGRDRRRGGGGGGDVYSFSSRFYFKDLNEGDNANGTTRNQVSPVSQLLDELSQTQPRPHDDGGAGKGYGEDGRKGGNGRKEGHQQEPGLGQIAETVAGVPQPGAGSGGAKRRQPMKKAKSMTLFHNTAPGIQPPIPPKQTRMSIAFPPPFSAPPSSPSEEGKQHNGGSNKPVAQWGRTISTNNQAPPPPPPPPPVMGIDGVGSGRGNGSGEGRVGGVVGGTSSTLASPNMNRPLIPSGSRKKKNRPTQ